MKKLFTLLALVIVLMVTSCEEYEGKQTPIKLDKSELTFPSVGGEQTVTAVNYNSWWISGGSEDYDQAKNEYNNYVYPTSTDGEDACTYDLLDGGWYYVVVPDKGNSNQVVITVSENKTSNPRSATITMQNRNAFTNIRIQQE